MSPFVKVKPTKRTTVTLPSGSTATFEAGAESIVPRSVAALDARLVIIDENPSEVDQPTPKTKKPSSKRGREFEDGVINKGE